MRLGQDGEIGIGLMPDRQELSVACAGGNIMPGGLVRTSQAQQ